ncbi:MAG: DinB family protein [Helicobacteraceae bacterium]|jgi:uncharacterized damage-inducible protein DinB|nr:DinB family protein [Helicobacteraceae bacterium]
MFAKAIILAFAKHNQEANVKVVEILDGKFSAAARQEERGSYYGSLEGLTKHIAGGTLALLRMAKTALSADANAQNVLIALDDLSVDANPLDINGWQKLKAAIAAADRAWVNLAATLNDRDYDAPVKTEWYGGNPASIPLGALLTNLASHNIHHRGQLSQIFDSLKIDNDYSAIGLQFFS